MKETDCYRILITNMDPETSLNPLEIYTCGEMMCEEKAELLLHTIFPGNNDNDPPLAYPVCRPHVGELARRLVNAMSEAVI